MDPLYPSLTLPTTSAPGWNSPQLLAERTERLATLPSGDDDRFVGYGVMGLRFASGHVLGLRRWPASSIGPGYTSVWHRLPNGTWRLYSDVAERRSCSVYISNQVPDTYETPIRLDWASPYELRIQIARAALDWRVSLCATPFTAAFGLVRALIPEGLVSTPPALRLLERASRVVMRVKGLQLLGTMPNEQKFRIVPRRVWTVAASRADWAGEDLGSIDAAEGSVDLGPFSVPTSGIFAFVTARFTRED